MKLLITITLSLLLTASSFTGKVIRITDGDTIVILTENNEQVKVRLEGIDCPVYKLDFDYKAKQPISNLCFGKEVKLRNAEKFNMDVL